MKNFIKAFWLQLLLIGIIVVLFWLYVDSKKENATVTNIESSVAKAEVTPLGHVTFCFRIDGREDSHLPALMGNKQAEKIYANGLSGFNWSLAPRSTGSEPYGVLENGQIFVKKSFLLDYGMTSFVEVKCDANNWVAQKMTETQIGGEQAYVYTPFGER